MSWSGGPGTCTCLHSVWGAHCCLLCCGATAESVKRKTTCPHITIVRKQSLPTDIGSHHRIELDWQRRNKSSACKRQYSLSQLSTVCFEHLNQEPKYENRLSLLQKHQLIQINGWLISYFKSNIFIHSFICISKIQYELDNISSKVTWWLLCTMMVTTFLEDHKGGLQQNRWLYWRLCSDCRME